MEQWIPQVREGSKWMRRAVTNLQEPYEALRAIISEHAGEEQNDFNVLFDDYRLAGGSIESIELLRRNAGGEALNAFMYARAAQANPVGLLGGIYIVEGTGNRIIPVLLPMLKAQLHLPVDAYRFLTYHGENDPRHLERWLGAVALTLSSADDPNAVAADIANTARTVANLYLMQLEHVL
jgi:3-oxoacyl-[acyl-carrier-protein] synthase-3